MNHNWVGWPFEVCFSVTVVSCLHLWATPYFSRIIVASVRNVGEKNNLSIWTQKSLTIVPDCWIQNCRFPVWRVHYVDSQIADSNIKSVFSVSPNYRFPVLSRDLHVLQIPDTTWNSYMFKSTERPNSLTFSSAWIFAYKTDLVAI